MTIAKEHWFVIIAAILYGIITAGGQFFINLGLSLFEVSFYRALFVTLILLPVILIEPEYRIKKNMLFFFAVYGLIGGVLELTMFAGIALGVPVAIVALLLYTQPVWTVVFGRFLLGEKITLRKIVAVGIGLAGTLLLVRSWDVKSVDSIAGVICALLGGVLLSLWVIWGRKSVIADQHYVTTTFGWSAFSVIWLLLLLPVVTFMAPEPEFTRLSAAFPGEYWLYMALFASLGGVIPHLLFYRGFQKIQAAAAGVILLLEPVSAAILAALFFSQPVGLEVIAGGALILLSNYFIIRKPQ